MATVVSDTTPLHYLVLIGRAGILEKLYGQIIIPPGVLAELKHPCAPIEISSWVAILPKWVTVSVPSAHPERFTPLDLGEREVLALAMEIKPDLVLLDDKLARRFAERESLKVKGTLGVIADAARADLLDFANTLTELQHTSMHLDQEIVARVIKEYEESAKPGDMRHGQ